jgi:phage terminase large subunit-like protein
MNKKRGTSNLGTSAPAPTKAEQIIDWIQKACRVPEGKLIGRTVELADWQKREIIRIYDNPAGTRRAILSFGRKNGKSALASFLMLAHLVGPLKRTNSQLYSTAQSRDQASLIYQLAAKIVRMSPILSGAIEVKDGLKELVVPEIGSRYRALSAEATTAFGLSPSFVIHDELGQVRGPRFKLYEALETATGAQDNPLSLIISTQAPTDADLLSVLIDDALAGNDPRVVVSLYCAPMDADPFSDESIKAANPAIGNFLNPFEVRAMAEDARRMPSREAEYRNLILNQRVEASNPFVSPGVWKACDGATIDLQGREVYCGLDLSEVSDLTALVTIGKVDGVWHVRPTFWLPSQGLYEKARNDRVPYDLWADEGYLLTTPGASISYDFIAHYMWHTVFGKHKVQKVAFDRWNMKHLKPWLMNAGFSEQAITDRFVEFGQGTQSMSPALRELESLILERQLRHGNHPVLNMCAANAVVEGNDSANRKLSKKKSSGRIDGMVALAMAIGVAPLKAKVVDITTLIA